MNLHEKTLLIGEELVAGEEDALLPKLKELLVKLISEKGGNLRKLPLIQINEKNCWLWVNYGQKNGYGSISIHDHPFLVHRFFYKMLVGEIPEGLVLDHLCRNRRCVNPKHLEPVTHRENVLRGISIMADNSRKTHCKRGHSLSGKNLRITSQNERRCRQCQKEQDAEKYKRIKNERQQKQGF